MIVLQIDISSVLAFEREGYPPVSSDANGIPAASVAREGIKEIAGNVQFLRDFRDVEPLKEATDPISILNTEL